MKMTLSTCVGNEQSSSSSVAGDGGPLCADGANTEQSGERMLKNGLAISILGTRAAPEPLLTNPNCKPTHQNVHSGVGTECSVHTKSMDTPGGRRHSTTGLVGC